MLDIATNATHWPDNLIALLERQRGLVSRLKDLASRQSALIQGGEGDALLGLLGRRQQIVDQFVASQDDLATFTTDLQQRLEDLPTPQAERIRNLLSEIGDALVGVMDRDRADQRALQNGSQATRRELSSLSAGKTARHAYVRPAATAARFADRHG
jgi:hypothetical protein